MLKIILQIIQVIAVANCVSFVLMRLMWGVGGNLAADIIMRAPKDPTRQTNEAVFLAAGILNQPPMAFAFAESAFRDKNLFYLNFKLIGWDACATACDVSTIIQEYCPSSVEVYTISLGEHVASYLRHIQKAAKQPFEFSQVAVNPCPSIVAIQKKYHWMLRLGSPLFEVICHLLGWLSVVPIIRTPGGYYSLVLLADQFWVMTYDTIDSITDQTDDYQMILSADDELLNNDYLLRHLHRRNYAMAVTRHGVTIDHADEYAEALRQLGIIKTDNTDS